MPGTGSWRGGWRTAAAKSLDPVAIDLAVRAPVRHTCTGYDELLMAGWDRRLARVEVEGEVEDRLSRWRSGVETARGPG